MVVLMKMKSRSIHSSGLLLDPFDDALSLSAQPLLLFNRLLQPPLLLRHRESARIRQHFRLPDPAGSASIFPVFRRPETEAARGPRRRRRLLHSRRQSTNTASRGSSPTPVSCSKHRSG